MEAVKELLYGAEVLDNCETMISLLINDGPNHALLSTLSDKNCTTLT